MEWGTGIFRVWNWLFRIIYFLNQNSTNILLVQLSRAQFRWMEIPFQILMWKKKSWNIRVPREKRIERKKSLKVSLRKTPWKRNVLENVLEHLEKCLEEKCPRKGIQMPWNVLNNVLKRRLEDLRKTFLLD